MNSTMKAVNQGRLAKQLYEQHGSQAEVAKILGVSVKRVSKMISRANRYALRPSWLDGLDERLASILIGCGYTSAEQVRVDIELMGRNPYIGPTRHATLRDWLAK